MIRRLRLWGGSLLFNLMFFAMSGYETARGLHALSANRPDRLIGIGGDWARHVIRLLRRLCGIRVVITGWEHIPPGPAIIASIHQSAFDTCIWMLLPRPAYVLKRELLSLPGFGKLMEPAGMIVVDRAAGASAIRHLMRAGIAAAADGRQIIIFPEGTRATPGEPRILQPGIAALASAIQAPILPVATNSGAHWSRRSFLKRPGTIRIAIGAPLAPGLPRTALMAAMEAELDTLEAALAAPVDNLVETCDGIFRIESKPAA